MVEIIGLLELINKIVILPVAIIAFILLVNTAHYLMNKNPDVVRAKIFLKYNQFKKAFIFIAIFGFVLVLHVLLIYAPSIFIDFPIFYIQRFLGLVLVFILMIFGYLIYKAMR